MADTQVQYIFVTGGVVSSLGKGIVAASLGRLLKNRGLKLAIQKLDPYINIDPGTMSPYQHGETFVYISCNPATLARDAVQILAEGFKIDGAVQPIDQFPQTTHVESITIFKRVTD